MSCEIHQECGTTCKGVKKYEEQVLNLKKRIAELEQRKCSHGDYRMIGTTDCKNELSCGGRTELYVIGAGLCISCINNP